MNNILGNIMLGIIFVLMMCDLIFSYLIPLTNLDVNKTDIQGQMMYTISYIAVAVLFMVISLILAWVVIAIMKLIKNIGLGKEKVRLAFTSSLFGIGYFLFGIYFIL